MGVFAVNARIIESIEVGCAAFFLYNLLLKARVRQAMACAHVHVHCARVRGGAHFVEPKRNCLREAAECITTAHACLYRVRKCCVQVAGGFLDYVLPRNEMFFWYVGPYPHRRRLSIRHSVRVRSSVCVSE